MLAHAARRAGFKPLVVDLWGDQDTRQYAEDLQAITSFSEANVQSVIDYFLSCYPVTSAVYGSGFERYPESLKLIDTQLTLFGNQPEVLERLQDTPAFFSLLKSLQIPYPDVSFLTPGVETGWLIKPTQGQGGVGIKWFRKEEALDPSVYWQKYQEGIPLSVLFLADGKNCQIIGFNRQWTLPIKGKDEFVFSGIINYSGLSDGQKNQIFGWLDQMVKIFSLKGLNSLDFIQQGQTSYVLEINPRPPASIQLYDANLFTRHIKACRGELQEFKSQQDGCTGYQIVYASQETQIPEGFEWPEGVVDIPTAGSIISRCQPICSIIIKDKEPQDVLDHLQKLQNYITYQLKRF